MYVLNYYYIYFISVSLNEYAIALITQSSYRYCSGCLELLDPFRCGHNDFRIHDVFSKINFESDFLRLISDEVRVPIERKLTGIRLGDRPKKRWTDGIRQDPESLQKGGIVY